MSEHGFHEYRYGESFFTQGSTKISAITLHTYCPILQNFGTRSLLRKFGFHKNRLKEQQDENTQVVACLKHKKFNDLSKIGTREYLSPVLQNQAA